MNVNTVYRSLLFGKPIEQSVLVFLKQQSYIFTEAIYRVSPLTKRPGDYYTIPTQQLKTLTGVWLNQNITTNNIQAYPYNPAGITFGNSSTATSQSISAMQDALEKSYTNSLYGNIVTSY